MKITTVKLANKAIDKLNKIVKRMKAKPSVSVGLPKGTNDYPDGTDTIMVGAVHEFGSTARGIPQRSYLRSTVNENSGEYRTFIRKVAKQKFNGKITPEKGMNLLGLKVQTDVRAKITDLKTPPLAQSTIQARLEKFGSKGANANPLIDTGHLRQSITYQVNDG